MSPTTIESPSTKVGHGHIAENLDKRQPDVGNSKQVEERVEKSTAALKVDLSKEGKDLSRQVKRRGDSSEGSKGLQEGHEVEGASTQKARPSREDEINDLVQFYAKKLVRAIESVEKRGDESHPVEGKQKEDSFEG